MSKSAPRNDITAKLNQPGPVLQSQATNRLPAPTSEQAMSLTLDQLRAYDRNPRTHRNPKYDEIKASIKAIGLKQKLTVTQRPGDDRYMISDGGNTRLTILNELYQETGDKQFFYQDCHFVPWQGEINVLAGHLAENDNRGQLTWIERARGIFEAKRMIEEDDGESISQRELTKRLRDLGYTINQSHVSKMLYTIEHFLPTIPLSLESGMGRPQIERLISYRQFCDECWTRCEVYWENHADNFGDGEKWALNVVDGDFAQVWHDEMTQLDHEGQTDFRWSLVEDRLKGMLNDHTGLHFNPIDMAWKNWFTVRKHARAASEEERADIWTTVDRELERLRDPKQSPLPTTGKEGNETGSDTSTALPAPRKSSKAAETGNTQEAEGTTADNLTGTTSNTESGDQPAEKDSSANHESNQLAQMRAQLEELEQRNADLMAGSQRSNVSPQEIPFSGTDSDHSSELETFSADTSSSSNERDTIVQDLTLTPHQESEGHRNLRHWQAQEHGEEAIDFEAAALKSIPLQSGDPVAPITDLWHVPSWRRNTQDLRMQIGEVIKTLASWAELEASGTSETIRLNAREGLGYELGALEGAPSRRAQLVWQLLASLEGNIDPMLPNELSVFGELVGSHGNDETVRLPDGLFIRVFWLTRLIRVLRDVNNNEEGDA